jgi:dihydrolipoamide dehydrogenase
MYDLIIIGGGPAGYHGAEKASLAGLNVALVEKTILGGVCLNEGCIPSKTLLHSSKLFKQAKNSGPFGVVAENVTFDLPTVIERKQKIVIGLRSAVAFTLKKSRVTVESGVAYVLPKEHERFRVRIGDKIVEAPRLMICTGSEPVRPPVAGVDLPSVMTNKEILDVRAIPRNLVVVGGGVIGLEMACFFSEIGSMVTVVEMLPTIAAGLDAEIRQCLKKELEKNGVRFFLETRVNEIKENAVLIESNGTVSAVDADLTLLSVGRRPLSRGLGLENIGVMIEHEAIVTDEHGKTSATGVWAAGDVNGKSMLAHTAYREAEVCIADMVGAADSVDYDAIPAVVYTHPEAACVGLTEKEAVRRGLSVAVSRLPLSFNGRYTTETDAERGMCIAVLDKQSSRLIGLHMVGGNCSEMIYGAAAMIENKQTVEDISKIVFPHPTVSEIIKETIMRVKF